MAFGEADAGALPLEVVESLLNHLPRAPFFVKDKSLRFISANAAMLELCGVANRADFIGKTSRDFFAPAAWPRYEAMDRFVMRSGRPIRDQLQMVAPLGAAPAWLLFSKWPVLGARGEVSGIAAMARKLERPNKRHPTYQRLAVAIEHIQASPHAPVDVGDLARRSGVSVSQFERDFVKLLGVSPRRYATRVRIDAALTLLRGPDPIAQIAHACGYADQSAFTRRFKLAVGMTPGDYRRTAASAAPVAADTEEG
ncbi:MAG: AraC family transcriptional regulator [Hyphomonadaceae bacterium]|nr:AraC family transcriptional regulator [Hyphomonadaceae bacterium]MBX3510254.1 AraC family transcriptional regulator [Hyphomonadaceae bacterium]